MSEEQEKGSRWLCWALILVACPTATTTTRAYSLYIAEEAKLMEDSDRQPRWAVVASDCEEAWLRFLHSNNSRG